MTSFAPIPINRPWNAGARPKNAKEVRRCQPC